MSPVPKNEEESTIARESVNSDKPPTEEGGAVAHDEKKPESLPPELNDGKIACQLPSASASSLSKTEIGSCSLTMPNLEAVGSRAYWAMRS